ncbi:MAG: HAMP domain-containing sensor histidine kinase [Mycobacterium sp.]
MAGVAHDSNEQFHAEQAYQHATTPIPIAVAIAVAASAAFVVTAYLSRRLQRSIAEVSAAASAVAEGRYDIQVAPPRLGEEFDELAVAFSRTAQRLQSVESTRRQLFGDLAHEIHPGLGLEAYLEAVEDGVKTLDPPTMAMLREQTGRLVVLQRRRRAGYRPRPCAAITPQWVDVDELVGAVKAVAAERYTVKGVTLTTRTHGGRLWADRQRLMQVLGNLLDNALRHTPGGGHVSLTASRAGTEVVFTVADDSEGIAPEHLPHLFEQFYRADTPATVDAVARASRLAIVKALTEAHGGHVAVTSSWTDGEMPSPPRWRHQRPRRCGVHISRRRCRPVHGRRDRSRRAWPRCPGPPNW